MNGLADVGSKTIDNFVSAKKSVANLAGNSIKSVGEVAANTIDNIGDIVDETIDFTGYVKKKGIVGVIDSYEKFGKIKIDDNFKLPEEAFTTGVSEDDYNKVVAFKLKENRELAKQIKPIEADLLSEKDTIDAIQKEYNDIDYNYGIELDRWDANVHEQFIALRNDLADEEVLKSHGLSLEDKNLTEEELLAKSHKNEDYISLKTWRKEAVEELFNKYEMTKGFKEEDYEKFTTIKNENLKNLEILKAVRKNNENEYNQMEYNCLTVLEDYKKVEDQLSRMIDNPVGDEKYVNQLGGQYLSIYNYLKMTNPSKAKSYLKAIEDPINQKKGEEKALARIAELSKDSEGNVKDSLLNEINVAGYGFGDGLVDFGEGIYKIIDDDMTVQDYEVMVYLSYLTSMQNNVYSTAQSIGNMTIPIAASTLVGLFAPEAQPIVSFTLIGASAYGNTKAQMLYEGYDRKTAMLYAGCTATSDAVLEVLLGGIENIGLSTLTDSAEKLALRDFALKQLREMVQEGGEEVVQDFVKSSVFDQKILHKTFDINDFSDQALRTFLQSAVVAGVLNGGQTMVHVAVEGSTETLYADDIMAILERSQNGENINDVVNEVVSNRSALEDAGNMLSSNINKYKYQDTSSIEGLNEAIKNNGLYHFTNDVSKILQKGYLKASDMIASYGNRKSFMFNGIPTVGAFATNLDILPLTATAVKIVPSDSLVNSGALKVRYADDQAISYDGNLNLDGLNPEGAYFVLVKEGDNLFYKEVSKMEYDTYPNTEAGQEVQSFIADKNNINKIKSDFYAELKQNSKKQSAINKMSSIYEKGHDINKAFEYAQKTGNIQAFREYIKDTKLEQQFCLLTQKKDADVATIELRTQIANEIIDERIGKEFADKVRSLSDNIGKTNFMLYNIGVNPNVDQQAMMEAVDRIIELQSNPDLLIGIHRMGSFATLDGAYDTFFDSGLVLTGHSSSGAFSNVTDNTGSNLIGDLGKNISFLAEYGDEIFNATDSTVSIEGLISEIACGGHYKNHGNEKGGVVIFAIPKSELNNPNNDIIIKDGVQQYVNPKYIDGIVDVNNSYNSIERYNQNYNNMTTDELKNNLFDVNESLVDTINSNEKLKPVKENIEDSYINNCKEKKENFVFYHGGANQDFNVDQIDILRPSTKQGSKYVGFYMHNELDREKALNYTNQSTVENPGLHRIELSSDANIVELDGFSAITRITEEQMNEYKNAGVDLIIEKNPLGRYEYLLVNKDKIINMELESINNIDNKLSSEQIEIKKAQESLKKYTDKLFNPAEALNDNSGKYNVTYTDYNGKHVPIINVTGEFDMLVHGVPVINHVQTGTAQIVEQLADNPQIWMDMNRPGANFISTSNISDVKSKFMQRGNLVLGFSNIAEDQISKVWPGDDRTPMIQSPIEQRELQYNTFKNIEDLSDKNKLQYSNYSEIVMNRYIKDENGELTKYPPNYLLITDGVINDVTLKWADYFGIPLVNVDSKKYAREGLTGVEKLINDMPLDNYVLSEQKLGKLINYANKTTWYNYDSEYNIYNLINNNIGKDGTLTMTPELKNQLLYAVDHHLKFLEGTDYRDIIHKDYKSAIKFDELSSKKIGDLNDKEISYLLHDQNFKDICSEICQDIVDLGYDWYCDSQGLHIYGDKNDINNLKLPGLKPVFDEALYAEVINIPYDQNASMIDNIHNLRSILTKTSNNSSELGLDNSTKSYLNEISGSDSLSEFQKNSIDSSLESLSWKIGADSTEVKEALEAKMNNIINDSEFGVRVDEKALSSILDTGLKNQFETNSSGGALNKTKRLSAEKNLFNVPVDSLDSDRPVYGMVFPKYDDYSQFYKRGPGSFYAILQQRDSNGKLELDSSGYGIIANNPETGERYSSAVILLKKDNIINNTTFTMGDSLDVGIRKLDGQAMIQGSLATNPTFKGADNRIFDSINSLDDIKNADLQTFFPANDFRSNRYMELQIHGQESHDVSNIKEVIFTSGTVSDSMIKKLESKGIPYKIMPRFE